MSPEAVSNAAEGDPTSVKTNQPENGEKNPMDKDERIANLEKDRVIMEEEFSKQLGLLGEKHANEAEVAHFWQRKHSELNQQFLKTDADLRVLRHENLARERQREERDREIRTRMSSLVNDRDSMRETYHANRTELQRKEEEIMHLRSQVKGLKDFVSTNSRTDGQVTDEVFAETMQRLGNGLQNWVIQYFRKMKIGIFQ